MLRIRTSLGLAAVALAAACNDGAPVEPPVAPDASSTAQAPTPAGADTARGNTPAPTPPNGTPRDTARGPSTPPTTTPRGDSIGISITPSPFLKPGATATLTAFRLSNTSTSTPIAGVAWESADPKVATVANGVVTAVALGIAPIRAQVEGRWLQVFVTVTADGQRPVPRPAPDTGVTTRPPTDTAGRGPTTPPAYVSEFTLGGRVFDATPGPDSATFKPIAGVTLTLVAVNDSGRAATPERVAGTATTDANGRFTLPKAPGGWYRLDVTPPAGSGYRFASVLVSRPVRETLNYDLALRKQP